MPGLSVDHAAFAVDGSNLYEQPTSASSPTNTLLLLVFFIYNDGRCMYVTSNPRTVLHHDSA